MSRTNILKFIRAEKYVFEIPLYQRGYKKENITRVIQDIKNVIKH